jgi:hypothetical protein
MFSGCTEYKIKAEEAPGAGVSAVSGVSDDVGASVSAVSGVNVSAVASAIVPTSASIEHIETFQHKSKQKKKIIIIKHKYKKIFNVARSHSVILQDNLKKELYISTPYYRRIILSQRDGIIYNSKGNELRYSFYGEPPGRKINWHVLYNEISKIMRIIRINNRYIILINIYAIDGGTVFCNILDNCGNYYYSHIQDDKCTIANDQVTVNGVNVNKEDWDRITTYDVPIINMLVDKLKTIYHQEDNLGIPILPTYYGDTNSKWCGKINVAINLELIRANKTKRKLDDYKTENRLLKLELLEAKKISMANKRYL